MRLLVVAFEQELEYCLKVLAFGKVDVRAVITVRTPSTSRVFEGYSFLQNRIFPYENLYECVHNMYFDYILLCGHVDFVTDDLKRMGIDKRKIIDLRLLPYPRLLNISKQMSKYYAEAEKYKMFITGLSYAHYGFATEKFSIPTIDFSADSQDIYYGYRLAEKALSASGQSFRYGLINLHPYSFHYDLSQTKDKFLVLAYALLLKDTHNYWISYTDMEKIFKQEFLMIQPDFTNMNIHDMNGNKMKMNHPMQVVDVLKGRARAEEWRTRRYPETVRENKKILLQYIRLCQKNKVEPLLCVLPCTALYRKYFSPQMLDEFYYIVGTIQRETGVKFFDYYAAEGFSYQEYRDCDHLNLSGSLKMTEIMNRALAAIDEVR